MTMSMSMTAAFQQHAFFFKVVALTVFAVAAVLVASRGTWTNQMVPNARSHHHKIMGRGRGLKGQQPQRGDRTLQFLPLPTLDLPPASAGFTRSSVFPPLTLNTLASINSGSVSVSLDTPLSNTAGLSPDLSFFQSDNNGGRH